MAKLGVARRAPMRLQALPATCALSAPPTMLQRRTACMEGGPHNAQTKMGWRRPNTCHCAHTPFRANASKDPATAGNNGIPFWLQLASMGFKPDLAQGRSTFNWFVSIGFNNAYGGGPIWFQFVSNSYNWFVSIGFNNAYGGRPIWLQLVSTGFQRFQQRKRRAANLASIGFPWFQAVSTGFNAAYDGRPIWLQLV